MNTGFVSQAKEPNHDAKMLECKCGSAAIREYHLSRRHLSSVSMGVQANGRDPLVIGYGLGGYRASAVHQWLQNKFNKIIRFCRRCDVEFYANYNTPASGYDARVAVRAHAQSAISYPRDCASAPRRDAAGAREWTTDTRGSFLS